MVWFRYIFLFILLCTVSNATTYNIEAEFTKEGLTPYVGTHRFNLTLKNSTGDTIYNETFTYFLYRYGRVYKQIETNYTFYDGEGTISWHMDGKLLANNSDIGSVPFTKNTERIEGYNLSELGISTDNGLFFKTGVLANYSTGTALLWGRQEGSGDLLNLSETVYINKNGNYYGNGSTLNSIYFETIEQKNKIGNPEHIDTLQEWYNHFMSAGVMEDCNLTKNNDGTINISSGTAIIRPEASSHTTLYAVEVPEKNNIAITENASIYVYLDWNNSNPEIKTTSNINLINCQDKCIIYKAVRTGKAIEYLDLREENVDANTKLRKKERETQGFIYTIGGSVISGNGLNFSVTAGSTYFELKKISHEEFNPENGDTYTQYYTSDSGGSWETIENLSTINNTHYNDVTAGMVALSNTKYAVHYVYLINNEPSRFAVVTSQEQYNTIANAENSDEPALLPPVISGLGSRIGKITIQEEATDMTVESLIGVPAGVPSSIPPHNGLASLDGGETGFYGHLNSTTYNSVLELTPSGTPTFSGITLNGSIILPKEKGYGIKVDLDNATFGWRDLLGEIRTRGVGATDPNDATYIGGIKAYEFAVNDEAWMNFHIPHDYVNGTDIYFHFHWSHDSTTVTGGSTTWMAEVTYAKGHNQEAFITPITANTTQDASLTQYQHMISEVQLSSLTPNSNQFNTSNIEPDGLIMVRVYLYANDITDSSAVPDPFLHFADIHYQTTSIGTKSRFPDFWT